MTGFADDPARPGVRVWNGGFAYGCVAMSGMVFIGAMAVAATVAAIFTWPALHQVAATAMIGVLAAAMWALFAYVHRDWQGRRGGWIALTDAGIELDLLRNRSLIHRPPACRRTIGWPDVSGVVTRLEAYRSLGFANVERPYWLTLREGDPILLFEERGIGSVAATPSLAPVAAEIVTRGGLTLTERGMTAGGGGLLGAWFVRPPAFDAPDMGARAERGVWRRVWWMGVALGISWAIFLLAKAFGG